MIKEELRDLGYKGSFDYKSLNQFISASLFRSYEIYKIPGRYPCEKTEYLLMEWHKDQLPNPNTYPNPYIQIAVIPPIDGTCVQKGDLVKKACELTKLTFNKMKYWHHKTGSITYKWELQK